MNALDLLHQMHVEARQAFDDIESAEGSLRGRLWDDLQPQLELHERIEERFVYDPVADEAGSSDPVLGRWETEHEEQVREADAVMARIDGLDPATTSWLETVKSLALTLNGHIAHEENDIWPRIRDAWSPEKLDKAGRQMEAARAAVEEGADISDAVEAAAASSGAG